MTADRFGQLLRNPALLAGESAIELEELIARYPWCGALRRLRYDKCLVDGDLGARSLWRGRAAPFLSQAAERARARALARANPARAELHFGFAAAKLQRTVVVGGDASAGAQDVGGEGITDVEVVTSSLAAVEWYLHEHALIMEYAKPTPTPKETLESYRAYKRPRSRTSWRDLLLLADVEPDPAGDREAADPADPHEPEVASETLAALLAQQGRTQQAIGMYEQLALRMPEKQATFAARIQALQLELLQAEA